jgi:hypothetical protein
VLAGDADFTKTICPEIMEIIILHQTEDRGFRREFFLALFCY